MSVHNNGSTTISYTTFGGKQQSMSIATNKAASFASRMIRERNWTTATILDDDAQNKLNELRSKNEVKNHVNATPYLIQLSDHANRLEKASSKKLITELERETLLAHTLVSVKELGMSREHALAAINRVYGNPAPAPGVKDVPVSNDPQVKAVFSGTPAPAQESLEHLPTKPIINTSAPAPAPVKEPEPARKNFLGR